MQVNDESAQNKAMTLNFDEQRYGTFAEIGAGQEVARHFFKAGRASHTVAKTMSAYDMTFSDSIYGKAKRYVSQPRLNKMLEKEYSLLEQRLASTRGTETCFFAFADTVTTNTGGQPGSSHGWLGVRFQAHPQGAANDVILHVRLLDRYRLQQQEAVGVLGVNLIYNAAYVHTSEADFVARLKDDLKAGQIEVDMIKTEGPDIGHLDNRLLSLELVRQELTNAVLFGPENEILQVSDTLFRQPVLVQRGTYRPVTKTNVEILKKGLQQIKNDLGSNNDPVVFLEITMHNLLVEGTIDQQDFLDRVDTLTALGYKVLISNFYLFYQLKSFLRKNTNNLIGILIGASHLEKLLDPAYYKGLQGGILEGLGRLFDEQTRIYVYPYKSGELCTTAGTFTPGPELHHLYKHLLENHLISDILGCDDVDTSVHSKHVRQMLTQGNPQWKDMVPKQAKEIIQQRYLFGYKGPKDNTGF